MKLEIISKYPSGSARPTPLLFIHGTLHGTGVGMCIFSITSLDMVTPPMLSICADTVTVKGKKNCAGPELLTTLKM